MKKAIFSAVFVIAFLIFHFFPLPDSIHEKRYSAVLESAEGELLSARISVDEQWRFAPLDWLPEKYQTALIAYEDRRFYFHPGVDVIALARAGKSNLQSGKIVSGGSTLTMQVARMLLGNLPRTFSNKLLESLLALKLEWHFSKAEILAMYANRAPFGGNTVGISAASWRYFSRQPESLSWAEAALLAVLPNSPSLMHLGRGRESLKHKRDKLLAKLHEQGHLDADELQLALLEPVPDAPNKIPRLAQHFLQYLIERYPDKPYFTSTLDATVQKKVELKSKNYIKKLAEQGVGNLAVVVIDNSSLELLAFVGNKTLHSDESLAPHVNIAISPRSSGSILKPFLYALMLQGGEITPELLIADIPTNYEGFSPQNYDREYRGAVPAKTALAQSLNIPAVRMLKQHGIPQFQHELKSLGISSLFRSADDYGLSLILGGAEVNLLEITTIYAQLLAVARDGAENTVAGLSVLKHQLAQPQPVVIFQGAAWQMYDAMLEVARPGTESFWKDFGSSQEIAWKTGTSYGFRDAWAVGSSAKYTVGVWAGNADGRSVAQLSGTLTAAPLLFEIFDGLKKSKWIEEPHWALKEIALCENDGYLSGGRCSSKVSKIPHQSHFETVTPHHHKVHLERGGQYRVHGACESVENMVSMNWFILPPVQEFYWKRHHASYQVLPAWRKDCIKDLATYSNENPLDLIYPTPDAKIYIPVELSGEKGATIFQAVHRNADAELFWHLDGSYLGKTSLNHTQELTIAPGKHSVSVVDEQGFRLSRSFEVLAR